MSGRHREALGNLQSCLTDSSYRPQWSWGKVMFLHVSVILSTISGGRRNTYGWQAGGTHPTGMLSCWIHLILLRFIVFGFAKLVKPDEFIYNSQVYNGIGIYHYMIWQMLYRWKFTWNVSFKLHVEATVTQKVKTGITQ